MKINTSNILYYIGEQGSKALPGKLGVEWNSFFRDTPLQSNKLRKLPLERLLSIPIFFYHTKPCTNQGLTPFNAKLFMIIGRGRLR